MPLHRCCRGLRACLIALVLPLLAPGAPAADPIDIGSRLELLADDYLIDRLTGKAELRLHHPQPREVALITDRPWEGNAVNYVTVFRDGDVYRMYYRGADAVYTKDGYRSRHREVYCYAESRDGVRWARPDLGLFAFDGSTKNNIVWDGLGGHNFTPFKDANPAGRPEAKYKALAYGDGKGGLGLYAFRSADGIHWSLLSAKPVITGGRSIRRTWPSGTRPGASTGSTTAISATDVTSAPRRRRTSSPGRSRRSSSTRPGGAGSCTPTR